MSKPALTIEPSFRSGLERDAAAKLTQAGVPYAFEGTWIRYIVPEREAKYLPDFSFEDCPIIIEPKGRFGGNYAAGNSGKRFGNSKDAAVKERQKFVLLKEQHPELDIRFVFSRASTPIYKGSKTSYGKWATDHGFKWSEKVVPDEWIEEIKQYQKPKKEEVIDMSDTFTIGTTSLANDLRLPPQARRVLAHLLAGKSISDLECSTVYRIKRLSDCIFKIRNVGYDVATDMREDEGGARYARYRLVA